MPASLASTNSGTLAHGVVGWSEFGVRETRWGAARGKSGTLARRAVWLVNRGEFGVRETAGCGDRREVDGWGEMGVKWATHGRRAAHCTHPSRQVFTSPCTHPDVGIGFGRGREGQHRNLPHDGLVRAGRQCRPRSRLGRERRVRGVGAEASRERREGARRRRGQGEGEECEREAPHGIVWAVGTIEGVEVRKSNVLLEAAVAIAITMATAMAMVMAMAMAMAMIAMAMARATLTRGEGWG